MSQENETSSTQRTSSIHDSPGHEAEGNPRKRRRVWGHNAPSTEAGGGGGPASSISDIDNSPMVMINEDRGIPISEETARTRLEQPSIGYGDRDKLDAGHGADHHFPIPTDPTVTVGPCSVVCMDEDMGSEQVPTVTAFEGASNFQISNTTINTIGGDAYIIRFEDGQLTENQRNLICDYIAKPAVMPNVNNLRRHVLTQSIITLPRAEAVFNDYQAKKKSGPCFEGTRVELLREMADWMTGPDGSRMYVLSGLAGIGKSTVAYTMASRAADINLLGASFFFSRDEADRNNAKKFFSTIAYQLCVYNESFAKAIGDVLLTERGSAATTKDPQEQLQVLVLEPLRSIIRSRSRPILIVVDALDECDEEDEHAVVMGLSQLVRLLPSFKVILTTRPQPLVNYLFDNHDGHKIFYLQDIEDKVVDGDIRLYLSHTLSLEQVRARLLNPREKWCASDKDIESLVGVAGRLFIIASTTVLYVLNKALGNPAARMKKLLNEVAQDRTPFQTLNRFYFVIVRSAIQANDDDDDDDIAHQYQKIVGTILIVHTPLPVATLTHFIGAESETIYAMLRNLQSVILLSSDDVPRVYHKSFPDYLTDDTRCKDPRLRIDTRTRHTEIAKRCFKMMDKHLKYNILDLGDPARFMSNRDGLREGGITDEVLQEKIPQELRYACVYWANHFEVADAEDIDLANRLVKFADEHLLHWFEILSLIGKLDLVHSALRIVRKLLKSSSSDLHKLLYDASRFISKFYEVIERSALHTYYSALPFTPTESLLYRQYIRELAHCICEIEGVPEKWDAVVAYPSHGETVEVVKFSPDSALFISFSEHAGEIRQGKLKTWDTATGASISTIPGDTFAIANDFSTVASSQENIITYYNVNGRARGTMLTTSSKIEKLALSSESGRIAAALADGTVWLWERENTEFIASFDKFESGEYRSQLQFSDTGTRLAYSSANGIVKLRDGISGKLISDLECGSRHVFQFSGDGTRIASLSLACGLKSWDSDSGGVIAVFTDVRDFRFKHSGGLLAISMDGSLLATAHDRNVKLWTENCDHLAQLEVSELKCRGLESMAFVLDNILIIADAFNIKLYNVKSHSFIFTAPLDAEATTTLAFSPDSSHLALGATLGGMCLWDIRGTNTCSRPSERANVSALALSRDCSRVACGFRDGRVELWDTNPTRRQITFHEGHEQTVWQVVFSPGGKVFASGSDEGIIKLWNCVDGSHCETLEVAAESQALALSDTILVAAWNHSITLWSLDTLTLIHTFKLSGCVVGTVSIAESNALIAVVVEDNESSENSDNDDAEEITSIPGDDIDQHVVLLLDVADHTIIATFEAPYFIHTMSFLPDNSQLVLQSDYGATLSFNPQNKHIIDGPTFEYLIQLQDIPLWHAVPVWHCERGQQHYISALFPRHKDPVPMLYIPKDLHVDYRRAGSQKSSMFALGYRDGFILLRLPRNHIG